MSAQLHLVKANPKTPIGTYLSPLAKFLDDPKIQNINVSPGVAVTKGEAGRQVHEVGGMSAEHIVALATLVANHTSQRVGKEQPRMSARLPEGHRIQFGLPPLTTVPRMSIRCMRPRAFTLDDLAQKQMFSNTRLHARQRLRQIGIDEGMEQAAADGNPVELLKAAIAARRCICVAGAPFSGKTTLVNALIEHIDETDTIFAIEDARELRLDRFIDRWDYEISATGQGDALVSRRDALADALRACPDRILLGEIRSDDEAAAFVTAANTGVMGSIGTLHASSAKEAEGRLAEMLSRYAGDMDRKEATEQVQNFVDVFVMVSNTNGRRWVSEVAYV